MTFRRASELVMRCALTMSLLAPALPAQAAENLAECQHHIDLEYQLNMPIYHWAPKTAPKGVVLALHGLVMHGQAYDELGKTLADEGFLVYSSDMRGYGRLTKEYPHEFCTARDCKQKVHYGKSAGDLLKLAERLKTDYPGLPLYIVGESMGADMAIRIASARPELAKGLVLSSPAIKAHTFIDTNTMKNLPVVMTNPKHQLNLSPYIRRYASEDPKVVKEMSKDPMIRRHMSTEELVASRRCINETLSYVPTLSADQPILVLQAKDDKCVRADGVDTLMAKLKSQDQQVRWFDDRGHILIETSHIKPDTMETILAWLQDHNAGFDNEMQAKAQAELISADSDKSTRD
ncbi:MAG: lysophospholipase [Candidatus Obscuribacterales bacterium]|nr:lysophospholipase [Candidatus Obscuribacterales bacterium]